MVCLVKSTRIRSKEDSHSKSINIHKVMRVNVTCYNFFKAIQFTLPEVGLNKKSEFILEEKIIDRCSFTFITNITLSQNDTFYDFNKDSFLLLV